MSTTNVFRRLTLAALVTLALLYAGKATAFAGTCTIATQPYRDNTRFASVPEPGGLALLGAGVLIVAATLRRKMKN